jgi:hypothetical protein
MVLPAGDGLPQLALSFNDALVVLAAVPSASPLAKAAPGTYALAEVLTGGVPTPSPGPGRSLRVTLPAAAGALAFVVRSAVHNPGSALGLVWGPAGTLWVYLLTGTATVSQYLSQVCCADPPPHCVRHRGVRCMNP